MRLVVTAQAYPTWGDECGEQGQMQLLEIKGSEEVLRTAAQTLGQAMTKLAWEAFSSFIDENKPKAEQEANE